MSVAYLRNNGSRTLDCYSNVTTTQLIGATTTFIYSAAFDCTGYNTGVFVARVAANSSADPGIYLEGRVDTTYWANLGTITADMTTTARNFAVAFRGLPNSCRIRMQKNGTTTTRYRLSVKACLKVV